MKTLNKPRVVVIVAALAIGSASLVAQRLYAAGGGVGTGQDQDALTSVRYELTIDGHSLAVFSELRGINSQMPVNPVAPSSGDGPLQKLPLAKHGSATVTLARGMTRNIELAAWHELAILGDVAAARKSASLTGYNAKGDPIVRYHLTNAWPSKVEIGALRTAASDALMETVTFVCDFMQRVSI